MSENALEVGDYVHWANGKTDNAIIYRIVRFCLVPRNKVWDRPDSPRHPGVELAPCNSRTLSVVPGRKTIVDHVSRYKRLNVLEALARVSKV